VWGGTVLKEFRELFGRELTIGKDLVKEAGTKRLA